MPNLPATIEIAEAQQYLAGVVDKFRNEPIELLGSEFSLLDRDEGRRFVRTIMKFAADHPRNLMTIAECARAGWGVCDEALRDLIIERQDRGEPLGTYLTSYNMELLKGGFAKLQSPKKEANILRDIAIASLVLILTERFAIKPTRNPASQRQPSACSLIAEALNMSEPAVVKIWQTLKASIA